MTGGWRAAATALFLEGVLAAPAQATVRKGSVSDPAGDARGGAAGTDVVVGAAQTDDEAGTVMVAVGTAAAPTTYSMALVGTMANGTCGAPYVLFVGAGTDAVWVRDDGTTAQRASIDHCGNTVGMAATDATLKIPFDCTIVATSPDAKVDNTDDESATFALAPDAPTPTPTPQATVAPAPPTTTSTTPPVAVPRTAKLAAALGAPPSTIKRNRTITLKLQLSNDGAKSTSAGTITIASAKGLSAAKRRLKLARLKPAQKRTVKLKVKLTRAKATLKVTAKAGKLKATTSLQLKVGRRSKKPPAPTTKKSPIVGTYWWRTVTRVDYAWDNRALYFVDDKSVYSGFPKGGLPAACTTVPAEPSEEVDTREGCLPYTYDEKTGALTIAGVVGTFKPGSRLVLDGNDYSALSVPAAGATFTVNEIRHFSFSGFCGLITGCSTTKKYLTLTPAGEFVLSRSTLTTAGDPGSGPYTAAGSYPPDQHGTYTVTAPGTIHLAFADGSVRDEPFAVLTNDSDLQPNLLGEGVMLGEENFYPAST
jgi:hypothetical protein